MGRNVSQKLIESHLVSGNLSPGSEIGIKIDQTLTQDATGTMVMLELESMGFVSPATEISVQYVDHNQVQSDHKNPDDHLFLKSAASKFGLWFSKPGNGISHQVHCETFGRPYKTLLGSDSHTPANGSLGMLAIGAGGLEVALSMCGEPFYTTMPKILGVNLTGELQDFVSAKDVILEMLRRYDVSGGIGKIIEYYGPGLKTLSVMDRHVIANMGAELGATTTVFPSDAATKLFLEQMSRSEDFLPLERDANFSYDEHCEIDLTSLEPLIALPTSPGNVVKVREVSDRPIFQAYIGSSANPSYRDFAISARMIKDKSVNENVSFDVNPSSRQVMNFLIENDYLKWLTQAGARIHQIGCNGCIGMGQAPATKKISVRTVPRNFPGRSGTKEDQVYLCSPETATASAMTGKITDPRDLKMSYTKFKEPKVYTLVSDLIKPKKDRNVDLEKGPNIKSLPEFKKLRKSISSRVVIKVGDNISTDEISPAGSEVLPLRSNIPAISKYTYKRMDEGFYTRCMENMQNGSIIVGGKNYGQGSSREHAAISTRYLGIDIVIAKGFARIHRKNLINCGALPLTFKNPEDYEKIHINDLLSIGDIEKIFRGDRLFITKESEEKFELTYSFSETETDALKHGGLINLMKEKLI